MNKNIQVNARISDRSLSRRYRGSSGKIPNGHGSTVSYESGLERDFILLNFLDPTVESIEWNPITLDYLDSSGAYRSYTPDVLVHYRKQKNGKPSSRSRLVEVKTEEELNRKLGKFKERFAAASFYAKAKGWIFEVVSEEQIITPRLDNARFLWRYRSIDTASPTPDHPARILDALQERGGATVESLLTVCYPSFELKAEALTYIWALIATHQIGADLDLPLTMQSHIWPVC